MKNRFLFVFMLLLFSIGAATGQEPTKHWQLSGHPGHWDPLNMTVTMVVQIDGEETANSNLELAGFIGDTLVSDGNFPSAVDSGDRFMYFVTLNGYDATNASNQSHWDELNFNHITFKLYDHAAEKEMTNCYTQIIYTSNGIFGNPTDPFEINFFSDEPQWELVTDPSVLKGGDNLLITNLANTLALSEVQNAKNRDSSPITVDSNGNITFVYPEPQSYDSTYYSEDDEEDVTETFWHYPPQIITLHEETEHLTMFVYDGYLYAGSSTSNMLATQAAPTSDGYWEFTYADGEISIVAQGENTRNTLRYAANSKTFNCFEGNKQQAVNLYRLVVAEEEETYTLTVSFDPEDAGTVEIDTEQDTYEAGSQVILTATPTAGYEFQNWTIGDEVYTDNPFTVTINANTEVVAHFQLAEYQVTITADPTEGGTAAIDEAGPYHLNDTINLTATPEDGYEFDKYTVGTTEVSSPYIVTEDAEIVAHFKLIEYTVTVTSDPTEGGDVEGGGTYHLNDELTVSADANEGYTFVNWTVGDSVVSTDAEYTFNVTESIDLVAHFEINSYEVTVTADPTEGGTVTGAGTYEHGTDATVTATPNEGYTFANWTVEGTEVSTDAEYTFTVTEATALTANFEINSYEVTVTAEPTEGGTVEGTGTYDHGTDATVTATPNEGYTFVNWTVNDSVVSTDAEYSFTVTEATALTANFEINSYEVTVTAEPTEGGTVTGAGTFDHGTDATVTATPNNGYTFVNWTVGGTEVSTNAEYTFTVTETTALVANFLEETVNTYIISVVADPSDGGTVTGSGTYAEGATITISAVPANGYQFSEWLENGEAIDSAATFQIEVTETATYTAVFTQIEYNVTISANPTEGGNAEITEESPYHYGDVITLTATPAEGYEFVNFTIDGVEVASPYTVTGDAAIIANFEEEEVPEYIVTVTVNPEDAGTVDGAGIYGEGTQVTLEAFPATGYEFVNFTIGDQTIDDNPYTFTLTGNVEVTANFQEEPKPEYTVSVTINPADAGTVEGAGTYEEDTEVTLTATPEEGYEFVKFTINGEEINDNPYTFTITADVEVVAYFQEEEPVTPTFTVTANVSPAVAGSVTGAGTYEEETEVTLTATANPGYTFLNWTLNGEIVSTEESITFTVEANVTYTANFEEGDMPTEMFTVEVGTTSTVFGNNGGTVTGAGQYASGATAYLVATPDEGFVFLNWTQMGVVVSTEPTYSFVVTEDIRLLAHFEATEHTVNVTIDPELAGTVTGAGPYDHSTNATLEATANTGYVFNSWLIDGETYTDNPVTFAVNSNVNVVAQFDYIEYEITAEANPAEGGNPTVSAAPYHYGETVTLNANANDNYEFVNWTLNDAEVATTEEAEFTIEGSANYVANFVRFYNVTVTADPVAGTAGIVEEAPYYYGDQINLTYTENPGYEFVNFTVNGEVITLPYTVEDDVEIVANFSQIEYAVTVVVADAAAGTAEIDEGAPYHYGDQINITYFVNPGYEFVNFTVNGEVITLPYTVEGDAEIVANYTHIQYTVTVVADAAAGTATINEEAPYYYGDQITIAYTENPGYEFVNFTVNDEQIELPYTVEDDVEIVANFNQIEYEINIAANDAEYGTVAIDAEAPYHYGDNVTVTATAEYGHQFINWTENGQVVSLDAAYNFTVEGDRDLVANFTLEGYAVNVVVTPEEGGSVEITDGPYEFGDEIELTATVNNGYDFIGWTVNNEDMGDDLNLTLTVESNLTIEATFELHQYNITVAANDDAFGTVSISDAPYYYNEEVTVTAAAIYGYHFVNWTLDGEIVATTEEATFTVVDDADYIANFEVTTYDITVLADPAEGGEVEGAGTYDEGETAIVTATANEHYNFVNWTEGGVEVSTDASYEFEVTADRDLIANFEAITFEITAYAVPAGYGTVEGAGTYIEGETATLVATPNAGYEFVNWTKNGIEVTTEESYSFEVVANANYLAHFQQIPGVVYYLIETTANPTNGGIITGGGEYTEGANVTLVATANEGFEFVNWTEDGVVVAETEEYAFVAEASRDLVANFNELPVEYTITVLEVENGTLTAPESSIAGETITVTSSSEPMYRLVNLYYYTTDPEAIVPIDLVTRQFVMPAADITIGGEYMLVEGMGDVNLDGYVDIIDVLTTINFILGDNPQPFDLQQADMNGDEDIDISDAMAINALILGLRGECNDETATYAVVDGQLFIESEVALAGYQFSLSAEPASVDMPGFNVMGKWSNGEYVLVVFNLNGEKEAGLYSILNMGDANLNNIVMATREGCQVKGIEGTVSVASFDEQNYSVYPVPANNEVTVAGPNITTIDVFNMMGQRVMTVNAYADETVVNLNSLSVGNYLFRINTANGVTTKNVVVVR